MTKAAALTKLLLAVIVMFVLCLPELFKTHQGITVAMTCKDMCSSDNITYLLPSSNISFICFLQQRIQNETVRFKVFVNQSHDTSGSIPHLCQNTSNDSQTPSEWFACATKRSMYTLYQELKSQALKVKGSLELKAKHSLPLHEKWDFTVSYAKEERQPLSHVLLELHIKESASKTGNTDTESTSLSVGEDPRGHISISLKLESPVPYAMCTLKIIWLTLIPFIFVLTLIFIIYNVIWRNKKSLTPLRAQQNRGITDRCWQKNMLTSSGLLNGNVTSSGKTKRRHSSASSQIKYLLPPISENDHNPCTK